MDTPPESDPAQGESVLEAADRVWDSWTGALDMPAPDGGADGKWHLYIVREASGGGDASIASRDPVGPFDRASTFGTVESSMAPGCGLDWAVARAVSRASLFRAAPATDEGSARAMAEALASLVVPCAMAGPGVAEFQAHPERTFVDPFSSDFDRGASIFFAWLDASFAREPGGLLRGLWALAPTRTPPGADRWPSKPTAFDVLRVSLHGAFGTDSTLDDVFARFALERSRVEPAPRPAWHIPWPNRARRLASPEPVSPAGASYVLIDHDGAPAGTNLRIEATWEDYGRMRWWVVKLDPAGRQMAALPVTSLDRGTRTSLTVESLEGVARLLVIAVNVGSTEHGFDPDQGEWEPHGWLLTVDPVPPGGAGADADLPQPP